MLFLDVQRCGYNDLGDQLCCQIIEGLQNCPGDPEMT